MAGLRRMAETIDRGDESDRMESLKNNRMRMPHPLDKHISVPIKEYQRLKTIEKEFQKGYDVVPVLFPSEDLSDYAHGARIKKSLTKALKQYPPAVWK